MSSRRIRSVLCGLALAGLGASACAGDKVVDANGAVPELARVPLERVENDEPSVRVVSPADGSTVASPLRVEVEVDNFELAPKGVSRDREGHFHVVVDGPCLEPGAVMDERHLHVGSGASSTELELPPGRHVLCIQLGDGFHTALAITETITVTVISS